MHKLISNLLLQMETRNLESFSVIPWAQPVLSFGSIAQSKMATLGLNPSNREFVDQYGNELTGGARRFHTLSSLDIQSWHEADPRHKKSLVDACENYFNGNPYDNWFRALERIFSGSSLSYYGMFAEVCHLDIVPFATFEKWGELSPSKRSGLIAATGNTLGNILRHSNIEVLILNGQSIIEALQEASGTHLNRKNVPGWSLPRKNSGGVKGFSYKGKISQVGGVCLKRDVNVLGFNHNIQSSFGVTSKVKSGITTWITKNTREVLC